MIALITLTIPPGGDAGPFDLYSNTDGYVTAFETGVSAAALVAGYTSTLVPNGTTIIRVKSVGWCTNYIDITINLIPTTTTTSSSSTTSTTTTAVPTTTTTSSSSTSTTTSTTTEFIPNLNSGSSGVQANPAIEGDGCNSLDYPYTPTSFPFPPSLIAFRVTNLSVIWSDIEYVEIVSVTDDPNMVITYDGNVVAPAMQFIPATDSTWQYPLSMTIDAFSCINTSETWEIRVKLTGYPISNIADAIINFLTNPFCPDCVSTTTTTSTSTSSTTTTTTTLACITYTATISTGVGNVSWTDCNGDPGFGEVTVLEPLGFCAQEGTPTSSTPDITITPDGPCSSPSLGCYSVTFNPDTECPGDPGHVTISYTECNGTQVIGEVISTGGTTTRCALVGGSELQPAYACGTGTIALGAACIQLGLISSVSAPSDACPLSMPIDCWISGTGSPNPGDVIYLDAAMTTYLIGDGGYYHFELATSPGVTYSAIVNALGTIESFGFTLCP